MLLYAPGSRLHTLRCPFLPCVSQLPGKSGHWRERHRLSGRSGKERRGRVPQIPASAAAYAVEPVLLPSQLPKPASPPEKLPDPPKSASLLDVVPYLSRLALSDRQLYWRLAVSLFFMIVSKAAGLLAPLFMKRSVDALSGSITQAAVHAAVLATLWSGLCRVVNSIAREAQGPIFTPVAQAAGRRVAYHTFWHVLDLDLTFHLERRTGALSRILEREAHARIRQGTWTHHSSASVSGYKPCQPSAEPHHSVLCITSLTHLRFSFGGETRETPVLSMPPSSGRSIQTFRVIGCRSHPKSVILGKCTIARCVPSYGLATPIYRFGRYGFVLKGLLVTGIQNLLEMANAGTRSVSMVFRAVVFTFIPTAVELLLVCGLLGRIFQPVVAVLVVATFVAYVFWTAQLTQAAAKSRKQVNELDNLTTGKAVDALLNYETVKLFNNEQLEVDAYDSLLVGYQKAAVNTEAIASVLNAGQGVILAVGLTGVLALAAATSGVGTFTAGDLVMAQGLLTQLWGPLQFLGWFYRELRQSLVDMDAFFQILQTRPLLPDGSRQLLAYQPPAPETPSQAGRNGTQERAASGAAAGTSGRGLLLELQDVHFGYDSKRPVLKGVSLSVERGKSCAIVGSSGSGKSTLLRILMRLYDVQKGAVRLEGIDVRDLQQSSLRSSVAVVPQETVLFNDTILNNIAYGRPGASREEIIQAAELAQLTKTIERMPEGFDTLVGERGLKLSGGERQRMAIARAFLRQPRLLICDEATSALDTATERDIMGSLERLAEGRTSIFVAHRLSTISQCDKIVVMGGGVIVEEGSHKELMAINGVYSDMWQAQSAASQRHELCQPVPMIAPNHPVAA